MIRRSRPTWSTAGRAPGRSAPRLRKNTDTRRCRPLTSIWKVTINLLRSIGVFAHARDRHIEFQRFAAGLGSWRQAAGAGRYRLGCWHGCGCRRGGGCWHWRGLGRRNRPGAGVVSVGGNEDEVISNGLAVCHQIGAGDNRRISRRGRRRGRLRDVFGQLSAAASQNSPLRPIDTGSSRSPRDL